MQAIEGYVAARVGRNGKREYFHPSGVEWQSTLYAGSRDWAKTVAACQGCDVVTVVSESLPVYPYRRMAEGTVVRV